MNGSRRQFLMIFAIGLASVGGAYLLFYLAQSDGVWNTTNHGAFVEPHTTREKIGWPDSEWQEKWWLWIYAEQCNSRCNEDLVSLRSVHVLLNREAGRVRRGITLTAESPQLAVEGLQTIPFVPRTRLAEGVYIVDPLGNLVFYYPLAVSPEGILEDLKRLLKLSQIG